jgi:hypothetical protein
VTCYECGSVVGRERGVKMTASLEICTKDKQHEMVPGVLRNERGGDPSTIGCQVWTELFATMKCVRVREGNIARMVI